MRRFDARILLAGIAVALLIFSVWAARSPQNHGAWASLGVFEQMPAYLDLVGISSALLSAEVGYDPLVENPADPHSLVMSYPRIWVQLPALLGVSPAGVLSAGPWIVGGFLASIFLVIPRLTAGGALLWAGALLSPPVLLGVERGNNDLVVFVILACLLAAHRAGGWWGAAAAAVLGLVGGVLKLYPIVALSVLLRRGCQKALVAGGAAGAFFLLYLFLIRGDLAKIAAKFPGPGFLSYGSRVLPEMFQYYLWTGLRWPSTRFAIPLAWGGVALALGAAVFFSRRGWAQGVGDETGGNAVPPAALDAFRAGASIYLASFVMGCNFDYRLLFLLFTLPALMGWARSAGPSSRRLGRASLWTMLPLMWCDLFINWSDLTRGWLPSDLMFVFIVIKGVASWALFTLFAVAFLSTLPDWAGGRFFGRRAPV